LRVAAVKSFPVYGRGFASALPLLARRSAAVATTVVVAPAPSTQVFEGSGTDSVMIKCSIASTPENVKERIEKAIKKVPVVLFMKGYPEQPMCGYSRSVVMILNREGVKFDSYNILDDDGLRQGIKDFTGWQTIPQLFIGGEFVGGADITQELHLNGELKKSLEKVGAVK
jgi:monothiol glutaredoxin